MVTRRYFSYVLILSICLIILFTGCEIENRTDAPDGVVTRSEFVPEEYDGLYCAGCGNTIEGNGYNDTGYCKYCAELVLN